jgi:hypothetical protein
MSGGNRHVEGAEGLVPRATRSAVPPDIEHDAPDHDPVAGGGLR